MGKNILLLYNPGAGHGQHSEKKLIQMIEEAGHQCKYASVKEKGWKEIPANTEWIAAAGGDGTIKRVIKLLHELQAETTYPVGVVPIGTANNIAKTLGISKIVPELIRDWGKNFTDFDTALIKYDDKEIVFGEGIGFGLIPDFIQYMTRKKPNHKSPQDRIKNDNKVLLDLAKSSKCFPVDMQIDGKTHEGEYFMMELLNIRSIGPNIMLSPGSDTGDRVMELVLAGEKDRKKVINYFKDKLAGKESRLELEPVPIREMSFWAPRKFMHIDDELKELGKGNFVNIEIKTNALQILT